MIVKPESPCMVKDQKNKHDTPFLNKEHHITKSKSGYQTSSPKDLTNVKDIYLGPPICL